jgi:FkbM family methyltransferase
MLTRLSRATRRVGQTLSGFSNGGSVLAQLVSRRDELVFEVGDSLSVTCPNIAGARVPVYEVFVEDAYRLDWFTGDLQGDNVQALDIGGHIGCFSLAFASLHPGARVQTFEASPSTVTFARRNVEDNGLADRVIIENIAVSDSNGTLAFADNGAGSGLNGVTAPAGTAVIDVPCITFAEALDRAGGQADVVKIDTEGAEYDIVLGSEPTDWKDVQRVVVEYHEVAGRSWAELQQFFDEAGLHPVHQEPVRAELGTVWLSRTPLPLAA